MDNVTHALAGLLMGEVAASVIARRTGTDAPAVRRAALALGVITAEFPDLDLLYAGPVLRMGKLGYLLHHRGHTHTVVAALAAALLCWLALLGARRAWRAPPVARPLLVLAIAGTLSHLALDGTNNYGVHPWWPLDNRWHYGDTVFIVEPWLWVASLGPLLAIARGRPARVLYAVLLLAILGAAWTVGMVPRTTALVLTVGAIAWTATCRGVAPAIRLRLAGAAWLAVEGVFAATGIAGRARLREAIGPSMVDASLTPAPADPGCLSALVLTVEGDAYTLTSAAVATVPGRDPASCPGGLRGDVNGPPTARAPAERIAWGTSWRGSLRELTALAHDNCEAAAALRFMRMPTWHVLPGDRIRLSDARYGEGPGSFASVDIAAHPTACPRFVPGWTPPRADVLQ